MNHNRDHNGKQNLNLILVLQRKVDSFNSHIDEKSKHVCTNSVKRCTIVLTCLSEMFKFSNQNTKIS